MIRFVLEIRETMRAKDRFISSEINDILRTLVNSALYKRYRRRININSMEPCGPFKTVFFERLDARNGALCLYGMKTKKKFSNAEYIGIEQYYTITSVDSFESMILGLYYVLYDGIRKLFDNHIWRRENTCFIRFNLGMDLYFERNEHESPGSCAIKGGFFVNFLLD